MLEALAAVEAFVEAVIGAGEDGARLARMRREPVDAAFVAEPAPDPAPAVAAVRLVQAPLPTVPTQIVIAPVMSRCPSRCGRCR